MASKSPGLMRRAVVLAAREALRKATVRFGAECIFRSGALTLLQSKVGVRTERLPDRSFPFAVLLYHRVNPFRDPFFPSLTVTAFEAQMSYLSKWFHVLCLSDIVQRIREGKGIEPWSVAITFDDGYRDNYIYAHPILKKYGLPATLFVPTAYVGSGQVLWNDRLAWAIKYTEKHKIEFHPPFEGIVIGLESPEDKAKALLLLIEKLKTYHEKEKSTLLDVLIQELQNGTRGPEPCMLTWSELRRMAQEGWDVGSHTVNHTILTKLPESDTRRELLESKATLEKELQRAVRLFAYPNGKQNDFNAGIKVLVREAGYEGAVTTLDGFNRSALDPYEIRRRNPWDEHLPSFALKMRWSYWSAMRDSMSAISTQP